MIKSERHQRTQKRIWEETEMQLERLNFVAKAKVSVSGDAFRFVEIDGVRYSHVIDPRTGLGVTGSRYCCVKGPSAFATDAAATVGCILDQDAFDAALKQLSDIEGPLTGWRFQGKSQENE